MPQPAPTILGTGLAQRAGSDLEDRKAYADYRASDAGMREELSFEEWKQRRGAENSPTTDGQRMYGK